VTILHLTTVKADIRYDDDADDADADDDDGDVVKS